MTKIQWTEKTINPNPGCREKSPGCRECYAAKMAYRLEMMGKEDYKGLTKKLKDGRVVWTGIVRELPGRITEFINIKKPTTYFVNSMGDTFHKDISIEFLYKLFEGFLLAPQHTFQVLTKRAEELYKLESIYSKLVKNYPFFFEDGFAPLENVWIGISAEDQTRLENRIEQFVKAQDFMAVSYISFEPLIGPITSLPIDSNDGSTFFDWAIIGGESGRNARRCELEWISNLKQDCKRSGANVFVKQLGSYLAKKMKLDDNKGGNLDEWPEDLKLREFPATVPSKPLLLQGSI